MKKSNFYVLHLINNEIDIIITIYTMFIKFLNYVIILTAFFTIRLIKILLNHHVIFNNLPQLILCLIIVFIIINILLKPTNSVYIYSQLMIAILIIISPKILR